MRNSKLILSKGIKIDKNYTNVLSYNTNKMLELCRNNKTVEVENFSFIRTRNTIQTSISYEICLQSNYIAFQNPDYSNKWFFAWIDNVEYKGNLNTEISYTIDVWSTWFDNWQKQPCFINRHHVNNDTIGLHTVQENIDVGEVFCEEISFDQSYSSEYFWLGILSNFDPETKESFNGVMTYNNTFFGAKIYLIQFTSINDLLKNAGLFIRSANAEKKVNEIKDLFIVPDAVVDQTKLSLKQASVGGYSFNYYEVSGKSDVVSFATTLSKHRNFNGINIKNNKCFCYPYNYLYVTNNNGANNIYKYEEFSTNDVNFTNILALTIGMSGKLIPRNYKGVNINDDEGLPLGKYPTCQWSSDSYIAWLTQQAVNIPMSILNTAISLGSSAGVGKMSVGSAISSVSGQTSNLIGQFYQASLLPEQISGTNTGEVNFSADRNKFVFMKMRCKNEYMSIIDNYFSRYGYKINNIELPNIIGRRNWNYVEIGANENIGYGDVPSSQMEIINNACRRGVTIWHNHENLGNFSLDNSII